MKKELNFEALATQYGLSIEFVKELHDKVVDKENFERALRMFKDGTLKYDIATGKDPINVAEIRKEIAGNFQAMRERVRAQMEQQRKIVEYYNGCKALRYPRKPKDGALKYEIATGKDPINIAEIRKKIAGNYQAMRERVRAQMEQQRKIVEYYNGCKTLRYPRKPKDGTQDVVFIKDGRLVAFARFEPKQGGIYAANNEVMPNFHWQPHGHLARLRKMNKAFYREVKKAAFADNRELFNFNNIP